MYNRDIFSQGQASLVRLPLKLLKILCTSSSISLYIPEHLCRLLWLGCLSYSGYFVSSGNTFVETSISVVPVCHHLAETVYFSLPLKWNGKCLIYWIVLKWTWLRLPFFPASRPNRQGCKLTMIGILFLIKYAANQSICGSNEILPPFWHIPRFSLLIFSFFLAAPISVNPTPPPLIIFLFFSVLLLISPTSPCVCWCLCLLIFNFGLRSSSVWVFFSLLFQSEKFLVFFPPFKILQFFFSVICCVLFCE